MGIDYPDGRFSLAEPPEFTTHDPATEFPRAPFISLDASAAQSLMDELFAAGIRPSDGAGSAGQLAAVQSHLADMRAIVAARVRVPLKPQ